jgi:hypothetical protein
MIAEELLPVTEVYGTNKDKIIQMSKNDVKYFINQLTRIRMWFIIFTRF